MHGNSNIKIKNRVCEVNDHCRLALRSRTAEMMSFHCEVGSVYLKLNLNVRGKFKINIYWKI